MFKLKIAITGSKGFLGKEIVKQCQLKSYQIIQYSLRNSEKYSSFLSEVSKKKFDIILNSAASLNPKSNYDFYINENLPRDIQNHSKFKSKLIHISSINVNDSFNLCDPYTLSKKNAEKNLIKKNLLIIRPSLIINNLYGVSNNIFDKYTSLPINYFPMIYPGNTYAPVQVSKLANFILHLIEDNKEEYSEINIQGKEKLNLWMIFNNYCKKKNCKAIRINIKFLNTILPTYIKKQFLKKSFLHNFLIIDRRLKKDVISI